MAKAKYADKLIGLKCSICGRRNYYTRKNKKTVERKIQFQKYCPKCRKTTAHKEAKISGK